MNKSIVLLFAISLLLASCRPQSPKLDPVELSRAYYEALNNAEFEEVVSFFYDSIRVKDGDYTLSYSFQDYKKWFEWDSVFHPVYEIIEIRALEKSVEVTVSKKCKRTLFLNEKPVITKEKITFREDKIFGLRIVEYLSFDNASWDANRKQLIDWIDINHPELNGFIHDQTKRGGLNYKRALDLYKAAMEQE